MDTVCVFGAGAVGGHLAARLAHAGHRVQVVARGAQLQAIRERGLELVLPDTTVHARVEATDDVNAIEAPDVTFVTVKSNALRIAAEGLVALARKTQAMAFVANGIPWWYAQGGTATVSVTTRAAIDPASLATRVPAERVVGVVAYSPNTVVRPGVVQCAVSGSRFVVGAADERGALVASRVRDLLEGAGVAAGLATDIRLEVWRKLALNAALSPVCTLAGAGNRQVASDPDLQRLCRALLREAAAVADAHGVPLVADEGQLAPERLAPHKPSMLQDLEAGRPLEIDAILTAVRLLARDQNVCTPHLDFVTSLVQMRAATRNCND